MRILRRDNIHRGQKWRLPAPGRRLGAGNSLQYYRPSRPVSFFAPYRRNLRHACFDDGLRRGLGFVSQRANTPIYGGYVITRELHSGLGGHIYRKQWIHVDSFQYLATIQEMNDAFHIPTSLKLSGPKDHQNPFNLRRLLS
ncbi:hypothetical protein ASPBRDRAFT_619014 [Aspergillus brasiliensis CBS 101740]|uniref:Uncharacterized protein n=1 Tax=Aspergillus brasiliensis (strain CBS 101740 / IMI 381727 / IBT 21946) TaxID=767769 RepID=A0A1L9UFE5_ASPBC|nr:hypothetical protein ASPBRDRAFT_619014 [Aspergillus brasiliensis CBS 101740]